MCYYYRSCLHVKRGQLRVENPLKITQRSSVDSLGTLLCIFYFLTMVCTPIFALGSLHSNSIRAISIRYEKRTTTIKHLSGVSWSSLKLSLCAIHFTIHFTSNYRRIWLSLAKRGGYQKGATAIVGCQQEVMAVVHAPVMSTHLTSNFLSIVIMQLINPFTLKFKKYILPTFLKRNV